MTRVISVQKLTLSKLPSRQASTTVIDILRDEYYQNIINQYQLSKYIIKIYQLSKYIIKILSKLPTRQASTTVIDILRDEEDFRVIFIYFLLFSYFTRPRPALGWPGLSGSSRGYSSNG